MSIQSNRSLSKEKIIFLVLFIIFFNLSLCLTDNPNNKGIKVPLDEKKREKYYSKIMLESVPDLKFKETFLTFDEHGFSLTLNEDLSDNELVAVVNKKHIISSCEFFPFKDFIIGAIVRYCNSNFKMNREIAVPLFTLVYRLLYLRFGDKDRAYKFYSHFLMQKEINEFYNYELTSNVKDYMMNMKIEANSSLSYDQEEISFTKGLKLDLTQHEFAIDLFENILEGVKIIKDEVYRESILPIVNNKEYFIKYLDFAFNRGRHIKVSEYAFLYEKQLEETYLNYQKIIADKFKK
jgi:hypothetical protein